MTARQFRKRAGRETNGELPDEADVNFDVLVTVDQNIRFQQNLTGRRIAVIIVRARSNRLVDLEPQFPACIAALRHVQPGTVVEVGLLSTPEESAQLRRDSLDMIPPGEAI